VLEVLGLVVWETVVEILVVVGATVVELLTGGLTTTPPGPATEVVRDPFSMYTPEKKKSSLVSACPVTGSSRTPTCQSAPLEETAADIAGTVRARAAEPVECQRAIVLAEKSCMLYQNCSFVFLRLFISSRNRNRLTIS